MNSNPHYFIGVPIPQSVKEELAHWQNTLKQDLDYKQWTNKDDFHITLKFLGGVKQETLSELKKMLQGIEDFAPFSLELHQIRTFGNTKSPRVLFLQVENSEVLSKLAGKVSNIAALCGFEVEKRAFRPHVTLAKKWKNPSQKVDLNSIITNVYDQKFTISIDRIHLFQIHPNRNPKYEAIESFKLKGVGGNRTAD